MTDKELREIRRRFRPDRNNILSVKGCIVSSENEIIYRFNQPLANCSAEESEKLLGIMKKSLSGGIGTNLLDLSFKTRQVMDDQHHKALMALRDSELRDEGLLENFYNRIKESINIEGSYAILVAHDNYDVFTHSSDDEKQDSSTMFSYMVCCVCPVKPLNAGLYFREYDNSFRAIESHAMLSSPELGFMFPSFDDRAANIYNALYYTRDISNVHEGFIENIFAVPPPTSAIVKKENFSSCLIDTLNEECDFEVVRSVHGQISEMVEEHKNEKNPEPLTLDKENLKTVLRYCGVGEEKVESFGENFDKKFGADAALTPKAIIDTKKFEVVSPDVSIKVNPERSDLVSTQVINGVRYIMIRANEGVQVNGVKIEI